MEIRDRKSRQMRQRRQENGARPKHDQRRERPHRAAKSRPDPFGLRGSLPPLAAEYAARVLAAHEEGIGEGVGQDVRQNRRGGIEREHGNHQGTTQATEVGDDTSAGRGVGENAARSIRKIHRFHSVIRHRGGAESSV
jgi:hypothetical protein